MATVASNDKEFLSSIEAGNPSDKYIDNYIAYKLKSDTLNSFITQTAATLFDYKYIETYYRNTINEALGSSSFVVNAIKQNLKTAFQRSINFKKLDSIVGYLSSIMKKICEATSLAIPFPNVPGDLIDIEIEDLNNLRQAYISEVRFAIEQGGQTNDNVVQSEQKEKQAPFHQRTSYDDEDLVFLDGVKEDGFSDSQYDIEIGKRIKKCQISWLVTTLMAEMKKETNSQTLVFLCRLYNSIAEKIAQKYSTDASIVEASSTIAFDEYIGVTDSQFNQIENFAFLLGQKESKLLKAKTGLAFPSTQLKLQFAPIRTVASQPDESFMKEDHSGEPDDNFFPDNYINHTRARFYFNKAARAGIISNDWKHFGNNCKQKNLIVYFCELLFCNGKDRLTELPADWIDKTFDIKKASQVMYLYHINNDQKPKGYLKIDILFENGTI